jgi:NTP pyrophosphatase (non-canonical NTP hydrolase)
MNLNPNMEKFWVHLEESDRCSPPSIPMIEPDTLFAQPPYDEDQFMTWEDGWERFVREYWSDRRSDTDTSDAYQQLRHNYIMATGLAGECGEVLEHLKKDVRDGMIDRQALAFELGDVLYYLTRIAQVHGYSLRELQAMNVGKLLHRKRYGKNPTRKDQ